jgi:hypothetical protein
MTAQSEAREPLSHEVGPLGRQTLIHLGFLFPELHSGDCQQDNGALTFYSNGTGTWTCTTLTHHTHFGDVWHSSFDVKANDGTHLFNLGTFDSPRMDDGSPPPRYNWAARFTFRPDLFDLIGRVTQHYSC